jgi:Asp-tRNA(Asn)/Glu-tRNA(Gln) amidotransferase A subunit family amidase
MLSVEELTIIEIHTHLKASTYTVYTYRQLTEAFLERIAKRHQHGPKLNSVLAHSSTALEEADALDTYLKSTSEFIGLLHGIPVIVKGQVETKGIVTTYGPIMAKNHVLFEDAT